MGAIEYVLGGVLIAMALFLVIAVLAQSGKDKRLSGSITGGNADTYFGKTKTRNWERILSIATTVISILFAVLVVVMYVLIAKFYTA